MKERLLYLFETDLIIKQPTLQKASLSDEQILKLLAIKPSDLNILLARIVDIINHDVSERPMKKTVKDILEVMERSAVARKFVGLGIKEEYHAFKGFPVREGDKFTNLPAINSNVQLDQTDIYQDWTTSAKKARKLSLYYNKKIGEAKGGLLVDTHVGINQLFFDINSVIKTVREKLTVFQKYNLIAQQGKSLSKKNIDFLGTEAPDYYGKYEILASNDTNNCRVSDTWTWKVSQTGQKIQQWSSKPNESDSDETSQPDQSQPQPQPQQQKTEIQP